MEKNKHRERIISFNRIFMFYQNTQHTVQHFVVRPRFSLAIIHNSETFFRDAQSSEPSQYFSDIGFPKDFWVILKSNLTDVYFHIYPFLILLLPRKYRLLYHSKSCYSPSPLSNHFPNHHFPPIPHPHISMPPFPTSSSHPNLYTYA